MPVIHKWLYISMLCTLALAACQPTGTIISPPTVVPPTPVVNVISPVAPTETIPPPRMLVVCLGQEPTTLYPYRGASRAMWSVLEALYDGPFDTRQFSLQPVILEKMPTLADGDVTFQPVPLKAGDPVVDADGKLTRLAQGTVVLPSGCNNLDCSVNWDGVNPLLVDRLVVNFRIKPGIKWSDGADLTSADSVYSYQVASDPDTPVSKDAIILTEAYQAIDDLTVQWIGKPGYFPDRYAAMFWLPLPKHAWERFTPLELVTAPESNERPVGWGPYFLSEWVKGDHIELRKNPNYYRAAEGLPRFDVLVYRFLGEPADNNMAALLSGECDIVDQTSLLDQQLEQVLDLQKAGKLKAYVGQGPEWEQVSFGIKPASYDDNYVNPGVDRPDFFTDARLRNAFALCMDRQGIVNDLLYGQTSVPGGNLPPTHPLFMPDLAPLSFDPGQGNSLLESIDWKDLDGNPQTPRTYMGTTYAIPANTPLVVNYATTQAPLRVEVAKRLAASLAQCGIQVNIQYNSQDEFYAPGPDGLLFGRKFDLAQFGWETGARPPCQFYMSNQIPNKYNNWLTLNITGYASPEFDLACRKASWARPDSGQTYVQLNQDVQRIFARDLPVIPLYFRPKVAVSRPDLCNLEMDVTARSDLWNLEALDYGTGCPK